MLSETEIAYLLKEEILFEGMLSEQTQEPETMFSYKEHKDGDIKFYYLNGRYDEQLKEHILTHLIPSSQDSLSKEELRLKNMFSLSLPGKDERLTILKGLHKEYVELLKKLTGKWETAYLDEDHIIEGLTILFSVFLDRLLIVDVNADKVTFETKLIKIIDTPDSEAEYDDILKNIKKINLLRQIRWVKELIEAEESSTQAAEKDKLTHKQQILGMHKLGIFDLQILEGLTDTQKGILFGHLLNRDNDNTENYIRYRNGKNVPAKYSLQSDAVQEKIQDLFKKVNLDK